MSNPIMKFTQPNIDAIRDGRKGQTRRPMKPQPPDWPDAVADCCGEWWMIRSRSNNRSVEVEPKYQVGDVVRLADPDGVETDLLIRITGVRAERLQDISEDDCIAELGLDPNGSFPADARYLIDAFKTLWSTIYGPENEFAWERNPWDFVYEFEVTK